ncbi:MAG: DNA-binding MarR family transcriptional regulator [Flavobacteriaceae bacterium]|jgi:DNA-binding MarR family transcriptional regulator
MLKTFFRKKYCFTFVCTTIVFTSMQIEDAIKSIHNLAISTKTVVNMMYTSRIIEEAIIGVLKQYDLTTPQYNVLRILRGQNGNPANLSTLQDRMIDKNSNTTRLVDKLIKKGWVKRNVCKLNRRKIEIFITDNGLKILKQLDPIIEHNNKNILSNLSNDELEDLNKLLDKLRTFKTE